LPLLFQPPHPHPHPHSFPTRRSSDLFCKEHRLRVVRETLGEVQLANDSIDCVAIWNTFDQLPDPEPTVSAARRLLRTGGVLALRSEEHTSELQSRFDLVCRLLLDKNK